MSEQYPWLVVGAKVTLIEAPTRVSDVGNIFPEYGVTYTVRDISIHSSGVIGIRLIEIVNPVRVYLDGIDECLFRADEFRPVRTTSTGTGMSILRKIDADVFQQDEVLV